MGSRRARPPTRHLDRVRWPTHGPERRRRRAPLASGRLSDDERDRIVRRHGTPRGRRLGEDTTDLVLAVRGLALHPDVGEAGRGQGRLRLGERLGLEVGMSTVVPPVKTSIVTLLPRSAWVPAAGSVPPTTFAGAPSTSGRRTVKPACSNSRWASSASWSTTFGTATVVGGVGPRVVGGGSRVLLVACCAPTAADPSGGLRAPGGVHVPP